MSDPSVALQTAIYSALTAQKLTVFSDVPTDSATMPYVIIGDDQVLTDEQHADRSWSECHSTVHVFSRAPGRAEVKTIAGTIRDTLHARLDLGEDFHVWQWSHESTHYMTDSDGKTKHAVLMFRYSVQPVVCE